MNTTIRMGMVAGAALLLAGCQSSPFAGWGFAKARTAQTAQAPAPKIDGAQLIEEGRALLAEGRISAAVATLRLARLDPATAAQAENGLGVAYAKLGRADLADRYFRAAIARDPSDMRFSANLLRLQHSVMLASRAAAQVRLADAQPIAPIAEAPAQVAGRQVHRATRGEFRVGSGGEPMSAPTMAVVYRTPTPKEQAVPADADQAAPGAVLALADRPLAKELVFPQ